MTFERASFWGRRSRGIGAIGIGVVVHWSDLTYYDRGRLAGHAEGWHEAASWSGGKLSLTALQSNRQYDLNGSAILRLVKMPDFDDGVKRWNIYDDLFESRETDQRGTVRRNELVTLSTTATITRCDGSTIPLDQVDDFMPALKSPNMDGTSCSVH